MKKRECSQGLEGGDFRPQEENTTRPLTEWQRHTFPQGTGKLPVPLPHGECGARGRAPDPGQASYAWALPGAIPAGVSIGSKATFARGKAPAPCKGKLAEAFCYNLLQQIELCGKICYRMRGGRFFSIAKFDVKGAVIWLM